MPQIFISYKRLDKEQVFPICEEIENKTGVNCWIDLNGVEIGDYFQRNIIGAIKKADIVFAMLTKNYIAPCVKEDTGEIDFDRETFPEKEIMYALRHNKRVVIISVDGTMVFDCDWLDFNCGGMDFIDWRNSSHRDKLIKNIIKWFDKKPPVIPEAPPEVSECTNHRIPFNIDNVSFEMIFVEGGSFTMGATPEQEGTSDNESPTHNVTLDNYYIGETPVTQDLWEAVMGKNPSNIKGENLPVESVSWHDCQQFIRKLNKKTGKEFRLPTEAEWEFAARGGNRSRHTQYSGSHNIDDVAWYDENSDRTTQPVKTKKFNELGIYDMSGNVWEWCQDWYGKYYSSSQKNPKGPKYGTSKVFRGGSWGNLAKRCRISFRYNYAPDFTHYGLGLRLCLSE